MKDKIVVNAGNEQLSKGDILEIYETGEEVIDPITKQKLGTLDYIKALVEVVTLYPNMCICENVIKEPRSSLALAATALDFGSGMKSKDLPINAEEISGGLNAQSKKIRVGDLVRAVLQ
ncbi:MAG: hypothetical protein FWG31_05865 [Oscillospiraceae bacterium]|nr:hypothetical protein [Oscillospiraceae bacterium]